MSAPLLNMLEDIAALVGAACPDIEVQIGAGGGAVRVPPLLHERGLMSINYEYTSQGRLSGLGAKTRHQTIHLALELLIRNDDIETILPPEELFAARQSLGAAKAGVDIRGCLAFAVREDRIVGNLGGITRWRLSCTAETLSEQAAAVPNLPYLKAVNFSPKFENDASQTPSQRPEATGSAVTMDAAT